jgi:hypothetical protein
MNYDQYYWGRLINYWVIVKRRNGLSIPFILGTRALTDIDFKIDYHSVPDLFNEIRNCDGDEVITLQHCENIGEYVLGLNDPINPKDGLTVPNEKTGKTKIIATLNTGVLGKTFDAIVKSLTDRYHDCLIKETYSRIDFKWTAFSDSDLKMISEALKK